MRGFFILCLFNCIKSCRKKFFIQKNHKINPLSAFFFGTSSANLGLNSLRTQEMLETIYINNTTTLLCRNCRTWKNQTQNTDDTEKFFCGPQQQILLQIEQVGGVSTGYKSHKVSREASKQKTECTGCKRKRKFSLDVKIKLATSFDVWNSPMPY